MKGESLSFICWKCSLEVSSKEIHIVMLYDTNEQSNYKIAEHKFNYKIKEVNDFIKMVRDLETRLHHVINLYDFKNVIDYIYKTYI